MLLAFTEERKSREMAELQEAAKNMVMQKAKTKMVNTNLTNRQYAVPADESTCK